MNQSLNAVAIGVGASQLNQNLNAVAIGSSAGNTSQRTNAVAIGGAAGFSNQGSNAVAIGHRAGESNQAPNSIAINASSSSLNTSVSGFFVNPIREAVPATNTGLYYDTGTKEIRYSTTKTFVIQHPTDNDKYLVHACLEGPEAGVYYRGKGTITNNKFVKINLPDYLKYIGSNYSINITKIFSGKETKEYETSEIEDNSFTVYGSNGSFYWVVFAEREKIDVEPDINDVKLEGDGPYKYLQKL